MPNYDVIIAGGGLAGRLCAAAIAKKTPHIRIAMFESGSAIGPSQRWSFFETDLTAEGHALLADLPMTTWPGYDVIFPEYRRTFPTRYFSFTNREAQAWMLRAAPNLDLRACAAVMDMRVGSVVTDDGAVHHAPLVIDARGWRGSALARQTEVAYQKFVGFCVEKPNHGRSAPTIMDASVAQVDGYRFVYTLPLDDDRLFVEDTYYSDEADLDAVAVAARLAEALGLPAERLHQVESGVLPVVLAGPPPGAPPGAMLLGVRAGLFHHVTSYSLPFAVAAALHVADSLDRPPDRAIDAHAAMLRAQWKSQAFVRLLNKMLFRGSTFEQRRDVMARFYRLPADVIERFYASRLTFADKLRILTGKPPLPVGQAIKAILK